jgi:hypothetical protein
MNKRLFNLVVRTYELKGAAYQVMLVLAWNASAANECSISISDLAADAHLTKKSVIRALQVLTSTQNSTDCRSFLTKAKQGIGVGIPSTYRIDLELLRDLNRRKRYQPATTDLDPRASDIPTPAIVSTNDGGAGNAATLVERIEGPTLRGQTNQKEVGYSDLSDQVGVILLSKREVTRRMTADAKAEALDIIAMMNGDKAIPWMVERSSEERPGNGVPTSADDGLSPEAVGEVAYEGRQICNSFVNECGKQPLFPRRGGLRSNGGTQTVPVASYPTGIRWPRR